MSMRRVNTRAALVLATVCALGFSAAVPASAADERHGYLECNPNRQVRLTSTTTTVGAGQVFAVGHMVLGGTPANWSTAGYHASQHGTPGGQWAISTSGTVSSGAASCA